MSATYSTGTYGLVGALGTIQATAASEAIVTLDLIGLVSTFDISANTGASVTVNQGVDVADT